MWVLLSWGLGTREEPQAGKTCMQALRRWDELPLSEINHTLQVLLSLKHVSSKNLHDDHNIVGLL